MLGGIVFAFKMKNFFNKNLFIHQNKYFEGVRIFKCWLCPPWRTSYCNIARVCSGGGAGGQRRGGAGVRGRRAPRPAPRAGCAHPRLRHPRLQRVQGALINDVTCLMFVVRLVTAGFILWNNGKEVPRWGVAEIQKMSPSTTGRCYCCDVVTNSPPIVLMRSELTNHQVVIVLAIRAWL